MPRHLIEPGRIEQFCSAMREQLLNSDIAIRKAYLRLFVERIEVDDEEVRMFGHNGALKAGLRHDREQPAGSVPSFVQEWRPQRDSNPCYQRERLVS
jgi:site-specific DNA recombinase